jgi:hypothetical protein
VASEGQEARLTPAGTGDDAALEGVLSRRPAHRWPRFAQTPGVRSTRWHTYHAWQLSRPRSQTNLALRTHAEAWITHRDQP